jgi:multiple sugar transport system permease protein
MATRAYRKPFRALPGAVRRLFSKSGTTLLAFVVLVLFLGPLGYMVTHGLTDVSQITDSQAPKLYPASRQVYVYEDKEYPIYDVPTENGIQQWALYKKGREQSDFIDPANPDAGPITWIGRWRTLNPAWKFDPKWENFATAWEMINFTQLFRNTFIIAIIGTIGTAVSSVFVAYGFSRFDFRGRNVLFIVLLATIILPIQATLIPTYIFFSRIGWTNTFLPLIVPHFFSNAYNVFLLRQYFLAIPRELDEAAMIDGASPLRVLFSVIIPQSIPAITAVSLFHFFFAWNDFFAPLVYLAGRSDLHPISVGIQQFNALYGREPHLIQTSALIAMVLPVTIFFLAQRVFMQGIVFTGVEK